nr:hypothetical protein CFP56_72931 [Quercus suber]POE46212.1 hypothetical protein CFP56_72934 [Quercus suber]
MRKKNKPFQVSKLLQILQMGLFFTFCLFKKIAIDKLESDVTSIWSIHSQQLRNLSQLYFLNLHGNDLYVSGLGWVSHLSYLPYLHASGINLQREKTKASVRIADAAKLVLEFGYVPWLKLINLPENKFDCNVSKKDNVITGLDCVGSGGLKDKPSFELSDRPDKVFKEVNSLHMMSSSVLYEYSIERYSACKPFDLGLTWKFPVVWSCPRAPIHSSRFLMGSGNQRGTIAISFISTDLEEGFLGANIGEDSSIANVVEKMHVSPSEDKVSPGVM